MNVKEKFSEVMQTWDDAYTFEEVIERIYSGQFQSFADGDSWVVTQVVEYPRYKVVEIVFMAGVRGDFEVLEAKVSKFAKNIGAKRVFATARPGFERYMLPGWEKKAVLFSKEISDG